MSNQDKFSELVRVLREYNEAHNSLGIHIGSSGEPTKIWNEKVLPIINDELDRQVECEREMER